MNWDLFIKAMFLVALFMIIGIIIIVVVVYFKKKDFKKEELKKIRNELKERLDYTLEQKFREIDLKIEEKIRNKKEVIIVDESTK